MTRPDNHPTLESETRMARLTYPFDCRSCGRQITHGSHGTGTGQPHGAHGLCRACYEKWRAAKQPQPVETYRHTPRPRTRYSYPFDCAKCGREITHPANRTGPGQAHGGRGLCQSCYQTEYVKHRILNRR